MRRVLVVGSLNADLVMRAARLPRPGETVGGASFTVVPGGKGANQAVAAARAGAPVAIMGRVGDDAFGPLLRGALAGNDVDITLIETLTGVASGTAQIVIDAAGRNTIVVAAGANALLSPADVDAATAAWTSAGVAVVQLETPMETVIAAARQARAHGVPLLLNAAPAAPLPPALHDAIDWLVVNETETETLTGREVRSPAEAIAAARALRRRDDQYVVVTLGACGAVLVGDREPLHVPAHEVTVVDTTAAGDAFVGVLAAGLLAELRHPDALLRAVIAGSLACTKDGAIPSLPSAADIDGCAPSWRC